MSLTSLYMDYLRTRGAAEAAALAVALPGTLPFESRLLTHYSEHGAGELTVEQGPWKGRKAWIGPHLPPSQEAGQLWFDTREVTAMVLVPRDPPGDDWHPDAIQRWTPFAGWLSLRPVAIWQYRAYLEFARIESRKIVPLEFTTHDPVRIFGQEDEYLPVTRLTCAESRSFANWMGKELPSQSIWQAARRLLPDAMAVLWSTLKKEWIAYPEPEEDEAFAISPQTLDVDTGEEADAAEIPPPERRTIYRYYDWSRSFGFRTAVFAEIGLYTEQSMRPLYRRQEAFEHKV